VHLDATVAQVRAPKRQKRTLEVWPALGPAAPRINYLHRVAAHGAESLAGEALGLPEAHDEGLA